MIHLQARAASARALRPQRLAAGARGARHPRDHGRVRRRAGPARRLRAWSSCRDPRGAEVARLARDRDQRPADRAAQPPGLPGGPGARAAAREPERRPAVARPARPRRAEGRQRPRSATRPATSACRRSPRRSAPPSGRATSRTAIGGDEFAVILAGSRALGALEFAQRVRGLRRGDRSGSPRPTELRSRDALIREADLALIGAKRLHQHVAIYGPRRSSSAAAERRARRASRWRARSLSPSTPRTPTRAATARRCRSCAR